MKTIVTIALVSTLCAVPTFAAEHEHGQPASKDMPMQQDMASTDMNNVQSNMEAHAGADGQNAPG